VLVGSVVGAATGLAAMLVNRKLNLKSALPFGPFLALGAFVHLVGGNRWLEFLLRGV